MRLATYAALVARETRGSRARLAFFVLCLAVGVAAVVAVAGLSASLEDGIRVNARELLAADLALRSRRPLPDELDGELERLAIDARTDVRELPTMASAVTAGGEPGSSTLVELKAVDGAYPFYGTLELDPPGPLDERIDERGAVASPELFARLGVAVGDTLRIGAADFVLRGTVLAEPDRQSFSLALGPRVFVTTEGLARADLERFGSRILYRALVRMPPGTSVERVRDVATALRATLPDESLVRIETWADAQPGLRRGIRRVDSYLGLVALLSLFVGGIGVAQTVRAWIAGKTDAIAVLECLGLQPRQVLVQFVAQTVLLALAGSAVGALLGTLVQALAPGLAGDLLPAGLVRPWQPAALVRGLALGLGLALAFSLVPLLATLRVSPARVLRRDAEALAAGRTTRFVAVGVLLAALLATATAQARSLERGALFTGAVLVAAAVLALAGRAVATLAARAPRERMSIALRHGVAALGRPQAGTQSGILALGLGTLVVLALWLVQDGLARELSTGMPDDAPTVFTIDVQPDQWPGVQTLFDEHGAAHLDSTPVVVARLAAIDGRPVEDILRERRDGGRGSRWVLTREQRLTYRAELPADNRIVAGTLWSDPERAEVSLEEDYAGDLGVGVGQTLTFDVQGVAIELLVSSLRTVEWKTFGINFFLIVEPGVLEEAPQSRIAAARVPPRSEQPLQDALVAAYPNVTMLRVREVLEKIVAVLDTIGLAVRVLGAFTVAAGVVILAGAVSAGSARREREVALLETIGMTRGQIVRMLATEHALAGLVAGAIGAAGGAALAWGVLEQWMELDFEPRAAPLLLAVAATVALSVTAGIAASARALSVRPVAILR